MTAWPGQDDPDEGGEQPCDRIGPLPGPSAPCDVEHPPGEVPEQENDGETDEMGDGGKTKPAQPGHGEGEKKPDKKRPDGLT